MKIIEANKNELNTFVLANDGSFQQTWEWGQLQQQMDRPVQYTVVTDDEGKMLLSGLLVRHALPFGKYYWFCPRGPVLSKNTSSAKDIESLLDFWLLSGKSRAFGGMFFRFEPTFELPSSRRLTFVKAPKDHNPRATTIIDLRKDEEALLIEMHHKSRYNIKLAMRKNVKIVRGDEGADDFLDLLKATAERGKFYLHPSAYYKKLLSLPFVDLFIARTNEKVLAGALVATFGKKAVYLHGASDYMARALMGPYLLHWEIMGQLKKDGLQYYDLGGISPKNNPIPGWEGLTRFKLGFGGVYQERAGTWDFVRQRIWYKIYRMARKVSQLKSIGR